MNGHDDEPSFDPRQWGRGAGDAPAEPPRAPAPGSDPLSFDPRTWGGGAKDSAATDRAATDRPGTDRPGTVLDLRPGLAMPGGARRIAPAAGAGIAILLAGAALAWSARAPAPPAALATAAVPVAAVVPQAPVTGGSRRTLVIAGTGDIASTLGASGITPAQANAATRAALGALGSTPGEVHLEIDLVDAGGGAPQRLTRLLATREDGSGVTLTAQPDGTFARAVMQARLSTTVKVVRGEMDATTFYNAAVNAGITDSLVSDFANAFSFDFDFQREVAPGDVFEAAFEQQVNPSGDPVGSPTLIYVSLSTQAKSKSLYRFLAPGDTQPGWYDGNGRSTVTALMRTPVDGARISSKFGYRLHPVLGFMKLHKGTDFAAPIGTPIYASGNAVVEWAAMKGPNGNLTILRHDNGWQTYYLHQSMFMPGIVPGAHVAQGQKIGEIGTTGRSTGPHLHYEVHIDGVAVDSMSIDTGTGKSLSGSALATFVKERNRIDAARAKAT